MISPQEISDKAFDKAVFGGYVMAEVDDFFETVTADYASLYKENAILKGKLKVLVEKVEEYRSTEDAMRMALLTAQRMGEDMLAEANRKKEDTLQQADDEAKARLDEIARTIAGEEMRLNAAMKETSKFIELSRAIMRKHGDFLSGLETAKRAAEPEPAPEPEPTWDEQVDDTAQQIGSVMEKLTGADEAAAPPEPESEPESEDESEPTKKYAAGREEDSVTPRPKFDFENLQFGSNFNSEN